MTPHISAKKEDIAKIVLMPGDPLRAKYIAEKFLQNIKLVNKVRNMFMYTGTYKNKKITIAGSGMGQPSIGIYSYELFKFYDVDKIIRIGSSGSYKKDVNIYDVVLAKSAYSDSANFAKTVIGKDEKTFYPSQKLNSQIKNIAKKLNIRIKELNVHSSDIFYRPSLDLKKIERLNLDCVEMEANALFINAIATNKEAACLLTISDHLINNQETSTKERETSFEDMMKIALEIE